MDDSSFSRLPLELIRKIFLDCLPDESGSTNSFKLDDAPLLLTHVCHTWRSIAEDTPLLWSNINIPRWSECSGNLRDFLSLWILRSRDVPLSVKIHLFHEDWEICIDENGGEHLDDLVQDILAFLEPHRARIKSLSSNFPAHSTPLVGIPEMANIENLTYYRAINYDETLRIPENFDDRSTRVELNLGPPKEKLRILRIADYAVDVNSIVQQVQLTHLELYHSQHTSPFCQEMAFNILSHLPNLRKCVMELGRNERLEWNGPGPNNRSILNNLESLYLIWKFPADIGILLNSIFTPNLTRLRLRGTPTPGMGSWDGPFDFLKMSRPPIRYLCLEEFQDINVHLVECLRLCPRVTHLVIKLAALPDTLLPALTCKGEKWDSELLPCLEVLELDACAKINCEIIATFLTSRTKEVPSGFSRIREVGIHFCPGITKDDVPILQQCGVEKLSVTLQETHSS